MPPPPGVLAYSLTPVLSFAGSTVTFCITIESFILTDPVPGATSSKSWFEFNFVRKIRAILCSNLDVKSRFVISFELANRHRSLFETTYNLYIS